MIRYDLTPMMVHPGSSPQSPRSHRASKQSARSRTEQASRAQGATERASRVWLYFLKHILHVKPYILIYKNVGIPRSLRISLFQNGFARTYLPVLYARMYRYKFECISNPQSHAHAGIAIERSETSHAWLLYSMAYFASLICTCT
jgi:hypothetical protein